MIDTAPAAGLRARAAAAIALLDLTSLDVSDTAEEIAALCRRAAGPAPGLPPAAAVCVLPRFAALARRELSGSSVRVACAAGDFPSGRAPLSARLDEVRRALADGAGEIDAPIDRRAFLAGEEARVADEISAIREACGAAALKVILETGELGTDDRIRRAAALAIGAGADFLKTSTGRFPVGATPGAARLLLDAAREATRPIGVKVSGGVRRIREALAYVDLAERVFGAAATPARFRIGASALLDELVAACGAAG
jgi:deoxyribose-phosphate aldolase